MARESHSICLGLVRVTIVTHDSSRCRDKPTIRRKTSKNEPSGCYELSAILSCQLEKILVNRRSLLSLRTHTHTHLWGLHKPKTSPWLLPVSIRAALPAFDSRTNPHKGSSRSRGSFRSSFLKARLNLFLKRRRTRRACEVVTPAYVTTRAVGRGVWSSVGQLLVLWTRLRQSSARAARRHVLKLQRRQRVLIGPTRVTTCDVSVWKRDGELRISQRGKAEAGIGGATRIACNRSLAALVSPYSMHMLQQQAKVESAMHSPACAESSICSYVELRISFGIVLAQKPFLPE